MVYRRRRMKKTQVKWEGIDGTFKQFIGVKKGAVGHAYG